MSEHIFLAVALAWERGMKGRIMLRAVSNHPASTTDRIIMMITAVELIAGCFVPSAAAQQFSGLTMI